MRLQFFKNDDIRKLFAPLEDINNEKLNFIFTLLETYKDLDTESAKKCVVESAAESVADSLKRARSETRCHVKRLVSESDADSDTDSAAKSARFNESATKSAAECVAKDGKYSIDVEDSKEDSKYDIYIRYITDAQTNDDFAYLSYSAANSANNTKSAKLALLHLIYAYLIIVKQK